MPFFAVLLYCAFSPHEFKTKFERMPESTVLKNIKEVLSVTDIVADAYHNFMPSYQEYVLQRSEEEYPEKVRVKTFIAGNLDSPMIPDQEEEELEEKEKQDDHKEEILKLESGKHKEIFEEKYQEYDDDDDIQVDVL